MAGGSSIDGSIGSSIDGSNGSSIDSSIDGSNGSSIGSSSGSTLQHSICICFFFKQPFASRTGAQLPYRQQQWQQ